MAFIARIVLFFQMTTVFPLLLYIFRIQVFCAMFGTIYPGLVSVLNECNLNIRYTLIILLHGDYITARVSVQILLLLPYCYHQ